MSVVSMMLRFNVQPNHAKCCITSATLLTITCYVLYTMGQDLETSIAWVWFRVMGDSHHNGWKSTESRMKIYLSEGTLALDQRTKGTCDSGLSRGTHVAGNTGIDG
jgi:hypothetical protein